MSDILSIITGKQEDPLFGTTKPRQDNSVPMTSQELVGDQKPRQRIGTPMTSQELVGDQAQASPPKTTPLTAEELVGRQTEMRVRQIEEMQRTTAAQRDSVVKRVNQAIGDFSRAAIQGATFGFSDEIAGAVSQLIGNRDFNEALALERAKLEAIDPTTKLLGELTGGVISAVPTAGLAGASMGIARLAKFGAIGATEGLLSGIGHAEGDIVNRAAGGVQGAAIGGVAGAAAGPIADRAVAAFRYVMGHPGTTPAQKAAISKLEQAMARDEITPERAIAKLNQLGPEAAIADLPGSNIQGLARATAGMPGPARNIAEKELTARAVTAHKRVDEAITNAASDESVEATRNAIITNRAALARPLYEKAFQVGEINTPAVNTLIEKSADVREGIAQARRMPVYADLPDNHVMMLDKAYKNLGGKYAAAVRSGDKEMARDLNEVRLELRKAMPDDYRAALDVFSSETDLIEALDAGRKFISADTEILTDVVKGMSAGEKQMFTVGVARAIREKLDNAQDSVATARRIFGNQGIRDRIQIALPGQFREFQKTMLQEAVFSKTANKMLGGSPTAPRQAEMTDLVSGGRAAMTGDVGGMLSVLGRILPNKTPSRELGNTMFKNDPAFTRGVFDQMQEQQLRRDVSNRVAAGGVGAGATFGGSLGR